MVIFVAWRIRMRNSVSRPRSTKPGLPRVDGNCAHSVNYQSTAARSPALDPFIKPFQHSGKPTAGWL